MSNAEERTGSTVETTQSSGDHDPAGFIGHLLGGRFRITAPGRSHDHVEEYAAKDERSGDGALVRLVRQAPPAVRERFLKSMAALAKVHHPCLPAILDHGLLDGATPYYVTSRIDGDTARDLALLDAVDVEDAVQIASGVASGLMAAHKAGVVHGDIRSSNIVVVRRADGGADTKILDFGLAPELPVVRPLAKSTVRGIGEARAESVAFGSLPHASPEQIRGEPTNERSDVYVLAAVVYELLSGTPPFPRDAARILSGDLDAPSRRAPDRKLPEPFDRVLLSGLSKDPAQRPGSPAELGSQLWQALAVAKKGARLAEQKAPPQKATDQKATDQKATGRFSTPAERPSREAMLPDAPAGWDPGDEIPGEQRSRRGRKSALAMIAALLLLFVAGWLFGRKTPGEASSPLSGSAAASLTASAPVSLAVTAPAPAETTAPPDTSAPAETRGAAIAAPRPRSSRPEPTAQNRAGSATTPTNYRVDDLKTPYR